MKLVTPFAGRTEFTTWGRVEACEPAVPYCHRTGSLAKKRKGAIHHPAGAIGRSPVPAPGEAISHRRRQESGGGSHVVWPPTDEMPRRRIGVGGETHDMMSERPNDVARCRQRAWYYSSNPTGAHGRSIVSDLTARSHHRSWCDKESWKLFRF